MAAADGAVASRYIAVTGQGEAAGKPDRAEVNAGVNTRSATVLDASRQNQEIVERIMKALDEQGIDKKNIQTTNYSIWPEQRQDPRGNGESTISGYNVNNMVNVTMDDIDKVGSVLAALTSAGANSVHGINFGVRD
ncbi:MAG: SIMPL domain-containing protein, partial [Halioglobus sp.]|nr:SIMPL domain-containing protein [Halioglobus sp.]